MNISDYGFTQDLAEGFCGTVARVTAVHKERYEISGDFGECFARLKAGVYYNGQAGSFPTAGDFVSVELNPTGDSIITVTLPRKTLFSRLDPTPGRGEQAVAANFDYVFIIQSLNSNFNPARLDRYLTLAWQSGAVPVVLLTKADLVEDFSEQLRVASEVAIGVEVHAVSAKSGFGLAELEKYLKPKNTLVFLGSSGVGKSSLVNALAGEQVMAVNSIREQDDRGRHTTTHRQLIMLKNAVMIIDTPGMRELGMWSAEDGLNRTFADVEQLIGHCRFHDCRHGSEPGCAVKAAIESGELSNERWNSYIKLKKEAEYAEDKAEYLQKKTQWHKEISKINKTTNKKLRF